MKVKKIISILLCAALIFGVMSVGMTQAFAADDVADSECPSNPGYTWDFSNKSPDSTTGSPTNTLAFLYGVKNKDTSIEQMLNNDNGELVSRQTMMQMSRPVTLDSSNDWTMEIVAKGDGTNAIRAVFSTGTKFGSTASKYIYIDGTGDMFLCTYGKLTTDDGKSHDNDYVYYKVSNKDYKNSKLNSSEFKVTEYHKYQMKCIDGVFSTWVDDEKIGNLCKSEFSPSTRSSLKSKIYTGGTGTPFGDRFKSMTMQYIGIGNSKNNPTYGLTATVDSLGIFPGHKYDNACDTDCNNEGCNHVRVAPHRWDDGVVITYPTATESGEMKYTCTLCGETKVESIPVSKLKYYVWDFTETTKPENPSEHPNIANTSGVTLDNELSLVGSGISPKPTCVSELISEDVEDNDVFNTLNLTAPTTMKMSRPVNLSFEDDWIIEFEAKAKDTTIRCFLSSGPQINDATFIYIDSRGDLCIVKNGEYTPDDSTTKITDYLYYKVSNDSYNNSKLANGFEITKYHKYQLRCTNGTLSYWLDNEEVGEFAMSELSGTAGRGNNSPYTGTPFDFSELKFNYIGSGNSKSSTSQGLTASVKHLAIYSSTSKLNLLAGLDGATPVDPEYGFPGDKVTLPTPETEDTCKEFLGWNTKNDGTGTMYAAGADYVFSDLEQQALYGIWKDAHDYGEPVWSWTGNDTDGYTAATATFTCSKCHATETVDATVTTETTEEPGGKTVYTATAEFQNETYTDTKTVYTDGVGARLAGHTISLDGDIAVNFYMELTDDIANSETAYMQFSIPDTSAEYQSQKVYVKGADKKGNYYVFNCRVAAKNMKSQITAQIMDPENNKEGTPYTYSVNQYANYLLDNQADNPTFQAAAPLVEAMIAYGDYSENYFSANEALDEINTVIPDGYALTSKNLPEGVSFTGATLSLKSQTSLSLYFKNENDEPITLSCDGREVKTEKINGEDVIRIRNIATAELNKPIKVKINNSDNYYVIYSPMAYCSKAQNSNSVKLRNSVKSLYNYWNEAYKYFVIPHSKQILLTNNLNWNNAYLYAWGNEGDLTGVFPGSLQYEIINSGYNNETQFKFYVPEDATGIVISNGEGAQTVDITDFNNYAGYWMDRSTDDAGHYNVIGFNL